jgi:DNA polymerase III subunit gamma/tau
MENFIVSARKYRPQTFDTVVGQRSITSTLKNAIRNSQLAQAFLFCGPRGVGKTTCARILAKTINCENLSPAMEACDKCPSCISFNENASFNIYELDGASNNSVDDIRTLVDQVRIPPQMGLYKVYIIDEVHMLSAAAFNAFLKTLEEPPAYAKFILATTEKHKIIPTILSRCQIFDFRRITVEDIAGHLKYVADKEHIATEENALHIIAQKADGAMRDALSIFDQLVSFAGNQLTYETVLENLNVLDYEYFFGITGQILSGDITNTLLTINEIIDKGFDGQHFLIGFGEHLRNLLVCKDPATAKLLETAPTIRGRYIEQAASCAPDLLLKMLDIGNKCDLSYKVSNNKRLHLEIALMQMCMLSVGKTSSAPAQTSAPAPGFQPATTAPKSQPATATPPPQPPVITQTSRPSVTLTTPKNPQPVTTPPTGTVRMKDIKDNFTSSISLKQPVQKTLQPDTDEENGKLKEENPFTQAELITLWSEFAETLKSGSPHLYSALKNAVPELKADWQIEFTMENKVLEDELFLKKTELMDFLRTKLRNHRLHLKTLIAETQRDLKPYTDKEKFDKMAEKNPALHNLREELDLEIEY